MFALACASTVALSLPLSSHIPIPKFRTLQEGIHLLLQFKGSVCPKARKRESVAQRAAEKYAKRYYPNHVTYHERKKQLTAFTLFTTFNISSFGQNRLPMKTALKSIKKQYELQELKQFLTSRRRQTVNEREIIDRILPIFSHKSGH